MSNKSYLAFYGSAVATKKSFNSPWECRISLTLKDASRQKASKLIFQFPVGMSNKSYRVDIDAGKLKATLAFNSPWECRISLTKLVQMEKYNLAISFNSPWECRISLTSFLE